MKKVLLTLFLLPLALFAKFQATTYFPLESFLVNSLAQNEVRVKEISNRYLTEIRTMPKAEYYRLADVKVYYHLGLDIEKEYAKLLLQSNPNLIVVDLSTGIKRVDNNPYIWMDPFLLRDIITNLYNSLIQIDSLNKDKYEENYKRFLADIDKTFLEIKQDFYKTENTNFYVYDDYWFYFANRFRLKLHKREKTYLNASEVNNLVEFTQTNRIRKLLFPTGEQFTIANSFAKNLGIPIVENDIFEDNILLNYKKLVQVLF